jgi:hypothetical protein
MNSDGLETQLEIPTGLTRLFLAPTPTDR